MCVLCISSSSSDGRKILIYPKRTTYVAPPHMSHSICRNGVGVSMCVCVGPNEMYVFVFVTALDRHTLRARDTAHH